MVVDNKCMTKRKSDLYFLGLAACFFLLVCAQDIVLRIHTPPGHIYPYLLTTFWSKFYYLSVIMEGTGSGWLVYMPYVIAPHPGSLIHYLYFVLGKIASVTHLMPYQIYALARIGGALLFLGTAVLFLRRAVEPKLSRIAFFLYLLTEPWPFWNAGNIFVQDFGHWMWETGEAVRRIGMLPPHTTIGGGMAVLSLFLVLTPGGGNHWGRTLLAAVISFIAGVIYPVPTFVIGFSYGAAVCCYHIQQVVVRRGYQWNWGKITHAAVYLLGSIIAVLLLQHETAKGFPWSVWQWEVSYFNGPLGQFFLRYPQQLGILLPLAIVGLFRRKIISIEDWLVGIWAFSGFILAPFATNLHLASYRIIQGQQWLPLSILAAYGISHIAVWLRSTMHARYSAMIIGMGTGLIMLYFGVYAVLSGYQTVSGLWPYSANIYIPPDTQQAFAFVHRNVASDSIVIAELYTANMLPGFARVRTVIGYPPDYEKEEDYERDLAITDAFLSRSLSEDAARALITSWHADIVYADASAGVALRPYTFLKPVYSNHTVVIARVVR